MTEGLIKQKDNNTWPTLSLCVVARNEETALPDLFHSIMEQTYPHSVIQLLLIDSDSDDSTRQLMQSFQKENHATFSEIRVLDNPGIKQADGWNVALDKVSCELVMRLDAHAEIPADYIERCVSWIMKGETICGGKVLNLPGSGSEEAILANIAENSLFGGSIAGFRHADTPRYVSTLAFAVYQTRVFDTVGSFDTRLARTEDNEIHYRMREAGYKFFYDPSIISYRKTRSSIWGLIEQKYLNGYWIGMTLNISPHCFSIYHFVPALFVAALGMSILSAALWSTLPLITLCGAYLVAIIAMTIASVIAEEHHKLLCVWLPAVFLLLHLAYGIGTIVGLIRGFVDKSVVRGNL